MQKLVEPLVSENFFSVAKKFMFAVNVMHLIFKFLELNFEKNQDFGWQLFVQKRKN